MNLQYIQDSSGKPTGVFIPIKDWEQLKDKLFEIEEDYSEPSKQQILDGLKEAIEEVNLAKRGKIKLKSFDDFLNEL